MSRIATRSARLIVTLALGILLAPLAAEAQQKVYRIGSLTVSPRERAAHLIQAFDALDLGSQ